MLKVRYFVEFFLSFPRRRNKWRRNKICPSINEIESNFWMNPIMSILWGKWVIPIKILLFKFLICRKLRLKIYNQGIVCVLDEFSNLIFSETSFEMKKFYFHIFFSFIFIRRIHFLSTINSYPIPKIEKAKFACTWGWNFGDPIFFLSRQFFDSCEIQSLSYHTSRDLYPSYINCNPFREGVVTGIGEEIFPCARGSKGISFGWSFVARVSFETLLQDESKF